jgi:hypothetical protein
MNPQKERTVGNENTQRDKGYTTTGRETAKFIKSLLQRLYEVVERMQNQIMPKVQQIECPETVSNGGSLCRSQGQQRTVVPEEEEEEEEKKKDGVSVFDRNVGVFLTYYTASHPRIL